jgi:hypothetical protein
MSREKTKSEDIIPQADKQGHTDIARNEGKEGAQARAINRQQPEKRKRD